MRIKALEVDAHAAKSTLPEIAQPNHQAKGGRPRKRVSCPVRPKRPPHQRAHAPKETRIVRRMHAGRHQAKRHVDIRHVNASPRRHGIPHLFRPFPLPAQNQRNGFQRNGCPGAELLRSDEQQKNHWQPANHLGHGFCRGGAHAAFGAQIRVLEKTAKMRRALIGAECVDCRCQ